MEEGGMCPEDTSRPPGVSVTVGQAANVCYACRQLSVTWALFLNLGTSHYPCSDQEHLP